MSDTIKLVNSLEYDFTNMSEVDFEKMEKQLNALVNEINETNETKSV